MPLRKVMTQCPDTGRPVHTGLDMRKEMFESHQLADRHVHCPLCGRTHTWSKRDAWLDDE